MEDLGKFLFQPKKFEDLISTAKVVIDTNVLLAAYQYRNITFKELIDTLNELNKRKRLVIPSHVIFEFFKNRPNRIVEIVQTVQQIRDSLQKVKSIKKIESKIPSMEYLNIHSSIEKLEEEIIKDLNNVNNKISGYGDKLTDLINELKAFFNFDPILNKYKPIFNEAFFKPDSLKSSEEIIEEFQKRAKLNLPPGYKDGKKTTNGEGDFIIWQHILQICDNDVIFITADNKADWVYTDPNDNVISARRELVEEFYQVSKGNSFCIVHPSVFLKEFNPSINKEILQDLKKKLNENKENGIFEKIEALNDEGNAAVANSKYSIFIKRLLEEQRLRPKEIPTNRYHNGDFPLLDQVINSISYNKELMFEVLRRADFISSDNSISDSERGQRYQSLAEWAIFSQD